MKMNKYLYKNYTKKNFNLYLTHILSSMKKYNIKNDFIII